MREENRRGHDGSAGYLFRIILIVLSGSLMASGILIKHFLGHSKPSLLLLITAMIVAGYRIALDGVRGLLRGRVNIDLLVTIAAVGATAIFHLDEGAAVLVLFNLAEYLEEYAVRGRGGP